MLTVQRLAVNSSSVDNLKANYDQSEITEKTFKATDLRVSMACTQHSDIYSSGKIDVLIHDIYLPKAHQHM